MKTSLALPLAALALCAGCATIAVATAPAREPQPVDTPKKREAVSAFWDASRTGDYAQLSAAGSKLSAAYFESPGDGELAALLGGVNTWRVAEFSKDPDKNVGAMQTSMFASGQYWADAMVLAPDDPLPAAFFAESQLIRGVIFKDEKRKREGFFILKDAVAKHPKVNTFVMALALSRAPKGDPRLDESIEHFWTAMESVVGPLDRQNPDMGPKMSLVTDQGEDRFIWGTPKVPHAFPGFFAIFGDVLVKKGEPALAKKIYAQARHSPTYADWPFQAELDQQIATADERAKAYPEGELRPPEMAKHLPTMGRTCSTCHQSLAASKPPAVTRAD